MHAFAPKPRRETGAAFVVLVRLALIFGDRHG
jgi:hypothetical protein